MDGIHKEPQHMRKPAAKPMKAMARTLYRATVSLVAGAMMIAVPLSTLSNTPVTSHPIQDRSNYALSFKTSSLQGYGTATGIASTGNVVTTTGSAGTTTKTEPIYSTKIAGYANISQLDVYKDTTPFGRTIKGDHATALQLNAYALVQSGKTTYLLVVQNVAEIYTNTRQMGFEDNVWPDGKTGNIRANALQNTMAIQKTEAASLKGLGSVTSDMGNPFYALPFFTNPYNNLNITLTDEINGGKIRMMYQVGDSSPVTFDVISTSLGKIKAFLTSNYYETGVGDLSSSFVLCGEQQGDYATYSKLNAQLGLFHNGPSGLMVPFTSIESPSPTTAITLESDTNVRYSLNADTGLLELQRGNYNRGYYDDNFDPALLRP